ncbi:sigma factor-like helix-turn-helix DNA-binding protein [Nostoc sp. UHCC 0252]
MDDLKQLDKYTFQVLTMSREGYSSRQIAQQFHLSYKTVKDIVERFSYCR